MRSIATDKMNDLYEAEWWTWFRFMITLFIISLFMIIEVVAMYYLITWSLDLEKDPDLPEVDFIPLEVVIPTCVWMFMSLVMEEAFKPIAFKLA
jgi:LytS/YehU family sensor histidine kinase